MSSQDLHALIKKIAKEQNVSLSGIGKVAGVGPDFIRKLKGAKNAPPTDKLIKLAKALNVDFQLFVKTIDENTQLQTSQLQPIQLKTVYMRGQVQAGQWTQATEWPREDWIPVPMPEDPRYKSFPTFALSVKGDSMNLLYPEGSIVIAVNFCDLGRNPENGECVVTIRRDPLTDYYEATLKIVQIREDGSVLLWPRSNNPDFTRPIQLPKLTTKYQGNTLDGDTSSAPDIMIQSLVIWSLNSVQKIPI